MAAKQEINGKRGVGRWAGPAARRRLSFASALLIGVSIPALAHAESATPGSVILLDPVSAQAEQRPDDSARERLEALPGGTALVADEDLAGKADVTASDVLGTVPGVIVQDFFGGNDQPRIQIRGSGLQQNPVERGILVLQNGLPLNRADGSYIVGLATPRQAEFTEIYRGYTANRLGATVLGGAINFMSPTGSSSPGVTAGVEGGSFGQVNTSAQGGFGTGEVDGLVQLDFSRRDGFRDYNDSDRVSLDANSGFQILPDVSTRFFAGYTDLGFDVAGPLTKERLESRPDSVFSGPTFIPGPPPGAVNPGPNVTRDRPQREASQYRIGNRTTAAYGPNVFDVGLGYAYTEDEFRFPISSGVRSTEGGDANAVFRYAYAPDGSQPLPLLEGTINYVIGSAAREYHLNESGRKGELFGENDLDATTLSLSAGLNLPLSDEVMLSPAIAYARATRDNDDTYGLATRPTIAFSPANPTTALPGGAVAAEDTSYSRTYSGVSPSLGLAYRPTENHMLFGAVSRSFEPPTHDDLIATVNGTPNSSAGRPQPGNPGFAASAFTTPDLKAQRATTIELGWRGWSGMVSWDAVTYYSWVDNELLSLRDETGASLGAVNADETRHFGIELGLGLDLTERLGGRVSYTYQDFRFVDDPVRGDNRLAGAPRHTVNAAAHYDLTPDLRVGIETQWSPERTPVDNMNSVYADPYVVVDLRSSYALTERFSLYGEVRNLFDETYASSTLIVDQARPDQAVYLPGDGRAFYLGLKAEF